MFSLTWEEFLPVHPVLSGSWSCSTTSPIIPCSASIWCHLFPGISTGALRACDKHAFLEQPSQWKKRIRILKSFTYTYTDGNAHTKTHKYVIHQKTKKKLIHDHQILSIIHPNLWLWINQWKFTKCEKHLEYNFANLFTHIYIIKMFPAGVYLSAVEQWAPRLECDGCVCRTVWIKTIFCQLQFLQWSL